MLQVLHVYLHLNVQTSVIYLSSLKPKWELTELPHFKLTNSFQYTYYTSFHLLYIGGNAQEGRQDQEAYWEQAKTQDVQEVVPKSTRYFNSIYTFYLQQLISTFLEHYNKQYWQ